MVSCSKRRSNVHANPVDDPPTRDILAIIMLPVQLKYRFKQSSSKVKIAERQRKESEDEAIIQSFGGTFHLGGEIKIEGKHRQEN